MLSLLISFIFLCVVLGILYWIISMIPFPAAFPRWVINVLFGLVFLIAILELFSGNLTLYPLRLR